MNREEYIIQIKEDILDWLPENDNEYINKFEDLDKFREQLYDDVWAEDNITGNGSCSYWLNRAKASEAISGALDVYKEAVKEFGIDVVEVVDNLDEPEYIDVTIRCYLLSEALDEIVEEYEEEFEKYLHSGDGE